MTGDSPGFPPRHYLVRLRPGTLPADSPFLAPELRDFLARWISRGWPAVVRRQEPGTAAGELCLGFPLPPRLGRKKIAWRTARARVAALAPPPLLAEVLPSAPEAWREALGTLLASAEELEIFPRIYGSFAWQHLTGEAYVGENSDLDLLFSARSAEHLERIMEMLLHWEHLSGLRADGELLFGSGRAVAWRELLNRQQARVLVKSRSAVTLVPPAEVLAALCCEEAS